MCIWSCRAAHHFSSSYCLKKKYLVFICFVSENRVPCGGLERWVDDEPELPGGSSACSKALPGLGNFRCAPSPAVRNSDRLLCCSFTPGFALCHFCSQPLESPRSTCPSALLGQCLGSPWPSLKWAYRAC